MRRLATEKLRTQPARRRDTTSPACTLVPMNSNRCPEHSDGPPVVRTGDPTHRRDMVELGPFHIPPLDLRDELQKLADDVTRRPGEAMRLASAAWLTSALEDAGVALDDADRVVVGVLAEDCVTSVQIVAGWIARARWPELESASGPSSDQPVKVGWYQRPDRFQRPLRNGQGLTENPESHRAPAHVAHQTRSRGDDAYLDTRTEA